MRRIAWSSVVLAAVLATWPPAAGAHPHGGGGGHQDGGRTMSHGGLRPSRAGVPAGPQHFSGPGFGAQHAGHGHGRAHGPAHFVHGGHGTGWWVVAGAWYPWYPAGVAVPLVPETVAYYYCPSAAAYFPAVQDCPEGWVLVTP